MCRVVNYCVYDEAEKPGEAVFTIESAPDRYIDVKFSGGKLSLSNGRGSNAVYDSQSVFYPSPVPDRSEISRCIMQFIRMYIGHLVW